jgi:hypothetical protein
VLAMRNSPKVYSKHSTYQLQQPGQLKPLPEPLQLDCAARDSVDCGCESTRIV